jgi:hypothetical protein
VFCSVKNVRIYIYRLLPCIGSDINCVELAVRLQWKIKRVRRRRLKQIRFIFLKLKASIIKGAARKDYTVGGASLKSIYRRVNKIMITLPGSHLFSFLFFSFFLSFFIIQFY